MTKAHQDKQADGSYSPAWRNFTKIVLPPSIRAMMRLDWSGQENFPASGGMILAANHLSYMDILALSLFTHSAGRYPVFLAKSSLFDVPVLGPLMRRLGQLRGETPPPAPFHPAVARRKFRQDLRTLQDANGEPTPAPTADPAAPGADSP